MKIYIWLFLLKNWVDSKFMYNGISAMVCKITYLLQNELHMSKEKEKKKFFMC